MELVEIRDLDGPGLFALVPVIKLGISVADEEEVPIARQAYIAELTNHYVSSNPADALCALITALHQMVKLEPPVPVVHELDTLGHLAVCFPWNQRAVARAIARVAFDLVAGEQIRDVRVHLEQVLSQEISEDEPDQPTWLRDSERTMPVVAITGTNGKTTTTRFLTHVLQRAGYRVGKSSSSGVYINDELVLAGDYSGHGGALRVLTDPNVDCAVLESARGGILLRGLAFESCDVSVFLNISADHLNLHGVLKPETLARVKATVTRVTNPEGVSVLNADDPLVLAQVPDIRSEIMLFSQDVNNPAIHQHLNAGGRCVVLDQDAIALYTGTERETVAPIADVPLSYGGVARHMVENALATCAAAIAMNVDLQTIREAMRTFQPDRGHNAGRLNVFQLHGRTVIVDFAHNESGLQFLLDFGRHLVPQASRLTAIVGTAGDRQDSVFIGLGRIAGQHADRVLIKTNPAYLRGRTAEETAELIKSGLEIEGVSISQDAIYGTEYDALIGALDSATNDEVIVIMCIEEYVRIIEELERRDAQEWTSAYA